MSYSYYEGLLESKFGVTTDKMQRIVRDCTGQQACRVGLYPDRHTSTETYGIVMKYDCIPAMNVIPFCQDNAKRLFTGDVYLFHHPRDGSKSDSCFCFVEYKGLTYVSLTHLPTTRDYLKVTTWTPGREREIKLYKDHVYVNETVANNPETQKFTVIDTESTTKDETAFTLVRIAAKDSYSYFSLQCSRPVDEIYKQTTATPGQTETTQADRSKTQTIVICILAILCFVSSSAFAFILYRRHVNRRKTKNANDLSLSVSCSENEDPVTSDGICTDTSVYLDCTQRLRSSYAEIGSISSTCHYVYPDDTSQRSLRVSVQIETVAEEYRDHEEPEHSPETASSAASQTRFNLMMNDEINNDRVKSPVKNRNPGRTSDLKSERKTVKTNNELHKTKSGENLTSEEASNIISSRMDDSNGDEGSASAYRIQNVNIESYTTMIPREHYDPSGYLSLDVPENTTYASLTKWKTEIYSVEQAARERNKNPTNRICRPDNVGRRQVRIVHKPLTCKPIGHPYHYANKHGIKFVEDETVPKPEIKSEEDGATNTDKGATAQLNQSSEENKDKT